ncbi:hypothetical protein C8R43DRAFT_956578 [Mycena crocata]|nr:hypothetical protein C8R43DRAFT_956578 [Mycena crocata]
MSFPALHARGLLVQVPTPSVRGAAIHNLQEGEPHIRYLHVIRYDDIHGQTRWTPRSVPPGVKTPAPPCEWGERAVKFGLKLGDSYRRTVVTLLSPLLVKKDAGCGPPVFFFALSENPFHTAAFKGAAGFSCGGDDSQLRYKL